MNFSICCLKLKNSRFNWEFTLLFDFYQKYFLSGLVFIIDYPISSPLLNLLKMVFKCFSFFLLI